MNRRSLLRFLGLAPVAAVVPAAVTPRPALAINTLDYWKAASTELIPLTPKAPFCSLPLSHGRWAFAEFPAQRLVMSACHFEGEPVVFDEPITVTFGEHFDIDEEPT